MANGGRRKPAKPSTNNRLISEVVLLRKSIDSLSVNVGKWLGAIALAAANPADNTAEVKKKLAEFAAELKVEADAFEGLAREATTNQKENDHG